MSLFIKQNRQVILLYVFTLLGTLLGMVTSIINTRFIDPISYGDVRYVQNIIQLLATVLMLGYFWSGSRLLAITDNLQERREIRGAMILVLGITSSILMLLVIVCYFLHINKANEASLFLLSLPVCINLLLFNYIENTAQGDNHIGRLAFARTLPYALYIPLAYFLFVNYGATAERILFLQWGVYTLVLLFIVVSTHPSFSNLRKTLKKLNEENKRYGLQLYYGSLLMLGSSYIAGVSLGVLNNDNSNVGFYTLAVTITTPLAMLPGIIGTTYYRQFAKMDEIPSKVLKVTIGLSVISCILFILIVKPLVSLLYTDDYSVVGNYAIWLSFGFCIHGIGDMINRYLGSHGRGKEIRNCSFLCGGIKIVGFTLFVFLWDINGAILTHIVSSTAYCVLLFFYYRKIVVQLNYSNCEI